MQRTEGARAAFPRKQIDNWQSTPGAVNCPVRGFFRLLHKSATIHQVVDLVAFLIDIQSKGEVDCVGSGVFGVVKYYHFTVDIQSKGEVDYIARFELCCITLPITLRGPR